MSSPVCLSAVAVGAFDTVIILIYRNNYLYFKMASSVGVILVESLRSQGVEYLFGIVGIPIVEVAYSAQAAGVKYESLLISMYNNHFYIHYIYTVGVCP